MCIRDRGGTDPDRSRAGGFAAVMCAADGAGDQAAKQGDFPWFSGCIFLLSPLDLVLNLSLIHIFSRIDAEKLLAQVAQKQEEAAAAEKQKQKPQIEGLAQIGIEDFAKVEMCIRDSPCTFEKRGQCDTRLLYMIWIKI